MAERVGKKPAQENGASLDNPQPGDHLENDHVCAYSGTRTARVQHDRSGGPYRCLNSGLRRRCARARSRGMYRTWQVYGRSGRQSLLQWPSRAPLAPHGLRRVSMVAHHNDSRYWVYPGCDRKLAGDRTLAGLRPQPGHDQPSGTARSALSRPGQIQVRAPMRRSRRVHRRLPRPHLPVGPSWAHHLCPSDTVRGQVASGQAEAEVKPRHSSGLCCF